MVSDPLTKGQGGVTQSPTFTTDVGIGFPVT